jgi:hypothetical protein
MLLPHFAAMLQRAADFRKRAGLRPHKMPRSHRRQLYHFKFSNKSRKTF